MKKITKTILEITHEGIASLRAAASSLENTLRANAVSCNASLVNSMSSADILEYLEDIDTFIIGQISNTGHLRTMLTEVSNDTFKSPQSPILKLHDKCNELDGFTVAALAEQSQEVSHELKEFSVFLCGASELCVGAYCCSVAIF